MLFKDMRILLNNLASDEGLIGPSVYDTAQVLRARLGVSDEDSVLDWLIAQQNADGGWGQPHLPYTRDVPTLAALLAIDMHAAGSPARRAAVERGTDFLSRHAELWLAELTDDLPVAIEILLPNLLRDARNAGLQVPSSPYHRISSLGTRRLSKLDQIPLSPGTPFTHSWEAYGNDPLADLVDKRGSVGNSPAATAWWLRAARDAGTPASFWETGMEYLRRAADATRTGIPGVMPTVWPIERFEQSFTLYALQMGGLLHHPAIQDVVGTQLKSLGHAMTAGGLGMSDEFIPDGDDTAVALAVLAGSTPSLEALERFAVDDHFVSYAGELHPSISVTAHAVHALALQGSSSPRAREYVAASQLADGRWGADKWHTSWIYTTSHSLIALLETPEPDREVVERATRALLRSQLPDGAWGTGGNGGNTEESAYGVLALRALAAHGSADADVVDALHSGEQWMQAAYRRSTTGDDGERRWLGKEPYRPDRIVRMFELAATMPTTACRRPREDD